ncbi:hypothetical protein [Aquimarina muelleri]|uniref:Uncharacterized protein n=1 Tax=Aquimarina muelleri TaxID=279356 RepID=A0A918JX53_9FLAO|nr:hypothetical protein [Aquimarina muelleri]MCX2764099.1 hypothetical protein [Aquimarina muelleri]GGX22732.1 hypothetical protein GCM10007384_24930 [Aquimarina muelleri]
MRGIAISQNVEYGMFKKYYKGYYQFIMDNGDILVFEGISLAAIRKFDLKTNKFKGKSFVITYSEYQEDKDEDFILYKIEKLELA